MGGKLTTEIPVATNETLTPNEAYNEWWREWYDFVKGGLNIYKFPMMLTGQDILGLNPEEKWKILHHMYLWKEIRTSITMRHGIGESLVYAAKVEYTDNLELASNETVTPGTTVGDG